MVGMLHPGIAVLSTSVLLHSIVGEAYKVKSNADYTRGLLFKNYIYFISLTTREGKKKEKKEKLARWGKSETVSLFPPSHEARLDYIRIPSLPAASKRLSFVEEGPDSAAQQAV